MNLVVAPDKWDNRRSNNFFHYKQKKKLQLKHVKLIKNKWSLKKNKLNISADWEYKTMKTVLK